MVEYRDVEAVLMPTLPAGASVSFPVPMVVGGRLYDVFFIYSVSRIARKVERPIAYLAVFYDEGRVVDVSDGFDLSAIPFEGTDLVPIPHFRERLLEASDLYGRVREEALAGHPGEATRRYVLLVRETSQPCLLPWYGALGLFDGIDSQSEGDS